LQPISSLTSDIPAKFTAACPSVYSQFVDSLIVLGAYNKYGIFLVSTAEN
jgi:hypothetical protein